MRFASWTTVSLLLFGTLGGALACGDDDDDGGGTGAKAGSSSAQGGDDGAGGTGTTAGSAGKGGSSSVPAGGEGGGAAGPLDSQLCTDLGGPTNIDAVVRGDGAEDAGDPFNGFKFGEDRHGSVLLNVATDPCIGQQFAHLLAKPVELEHLAQCLSLFVQNAAGCAVAYAGATDSAGVPCKSMKAAHVGLGITDEDYTALVMDAAAALIDAGVAADSPQFAAVAGALTSDELKADVITTEDEGFSQAGEMCEAAGGTGAGGATGNAGAGGAP